MSDFAGYVCWSPDDAEQVLAPVVESAGEAAFLATHLSLPIAPEVSRFLGERELVTEPDILEEFTSFDRDPSIMAVVGPPGSGKSHLIRWLYAHLAGQDDSLVLYVPREDTSLQVVLKRVLSALPGEEATALYEDIRAATDKWTRRPELAIANVLDMIGNQLEYAPPAVTSSDDVLRRDVLTGWADGRRIREPALSRLLRVDGVRKALLDVEGIVARNVRIALSQYVPEEGGPPKYGPDDLVLALPHGTAGLSRDVQSVQALLSAQTPEGDEWRTLAADLLNQCLDEAIGSLIGLSTSVSLVEVMSKARALLKDEGRDLLLLIEDFALFDRVGPALIDALVTPSGDDRCRLRTAFAITDDPYQRLGETLRSRVGLRYRTGVLFDTAGLGDTSTAFDFIGRYMNAARLGNDKLRDAFSAAAEGARSRQDWVPNACETCPHLDECHDRSGFGATTEGFGLYPLNVVAAERLIRASLDDGRFVPRTLLSHVLGPLLETDAEAIAAATFPTRAFEVRTIALPNGRSVQPVAAEVVKQLEDDRDTHRERRVRALRFWRRGFVTEAVDLGEPIHHAFQLPLIGVERDEEEPELDPAPAPPPPLPSPEYTEIDRWASDPDAGLTTKTTDRLQRRLWELVVGHIDWNGYLISPTVPEVRETGEIVAPESFLIDKRAGARNPKPNALRWTIPANASSAVLLKSVLRLESNEYFSSGREYATLAARIGQWADDVVVRCRSYVVDTFPLDAAIQCLIACAWLEGVDPAAYGDPVAAISAAVSTPKHDIQAGSTAVWQQLVGAASSPDREALRIRFLSWCQAAQGEGGVLGFDLAGSIPAAQRFLTTLQFDEVPKSAPIELRQLRERLARFLAVGSRAEAERLAQMSAQLDWQAVRNNATVASAILAAVNDAANRGGVFEPGEQRGLFTARCQWFSSVSVESLEVLSRYESELREDFGPRHVLAIIESLRVAPLAEEVASFLAEAARNLELSIQAADREIRQHFVDETPDQVLGQLSSALTDIATNIGVIKSWVAHQ